MSDEEKRKGQKPVPTLSEALSVLEDCYGFDKGDFKQIKLLDSYDDCNFFVETESGRFLLKCYNGVESDNPPIIEAQTAMMNLLASNGVHTSSSVICNTGEDVAWPQLRIFDKSERRCAVRLCRWVEGAPLVGRATDKLLIQAGELLGFVHQVFDSHSFDHPGLHRYHQWDQKNTGDLTTFTSAVLDDSRRQLVERIISRFELEVLSVQDALRQSALQADFNDANIIVIPEACESVGVQGRSTLGLIDYGDIVKGWLVSDVAIGAAYATVSSYGQKRPFTAAALLIHGFTRKFQLTELEKQILPLLTVCRLTTSVVLGAFSYQQQPECSYLLLHAEPAWASLEALTADHIQKDMTKLFHLASSPDGCIQAILEAGAAIEAALQT